MSTKDHEYTRQVLDDFKGDVISAFKSKPSALTQLLITYHLLRAYSKDAPIPFARPIAALSRLESLPQEAPVELVTEKCRIL
jgi:hypothetical protein